MLASHCQVRTQILTRVWWLTLRKWNVLTRKHRRVGLRWKIFHGNQNETNFVKRSIILLKGLLQGNSFQTWIQVPRQRHTWKVMNVTNANLSFSFNSIFHLIWSFHLPPLVPPCRCPYNGTELTTLKQWHFMKIKCILTIRIQGNAVVTSLTTRITRRPCSPWGQRPV